MTLVAGFKHMGAPILFGDFLLSVSGTPSGLRRKLFRLGNNFVVGWTGSRLTAETVMSNLFGKFGGTNPTFDEVKRFLVTHSLPTSSDMQATIIGWVVDNASHCFCWWSDYPYEVYKDESYFFGTGGPTLLRLVENPGLTSLRGLEGKRSPADLAASFSLNLAGRLLTDELFEKNNQKNCFGFAYEILVYDGSAFKYIEDILYVTCDFSNADISKIVNPRYYKVKQLGEVSVIQKTNIQTDHTEIDLISPVFDSPEVKITAYKFLDWMKKEKKTKPFSVTSSYYCLAYRLKENDGKTFSGAFVFLNAGPNQPITISRLNEETEELTIELSTLYDFIVAYRAGHL
jgi:hypothetical protein